MSIFWIVKIIFLEKVMAVLVDKVQAMRGQHGKPVLERSNTKSILDLFAAESVDLYF
jgi:hypothetical protein